jgi:acyl transferase domain-containing protein
MNTTGAPDPQPAHEAPTVPSGPYADQYDPQDGIAIVGMAGRFPGANSVDAFWRNVLAQTVSVSHFSPEALQDSFREDMLARQHPGYVRARGVLDGVDEFDEAFFGFTPAEAALLDPAAPSVPSGLLGSA